MADEGLGESLAANLTPEEWQRVLLASMQPERSPTRVVVSPDAPAPALGLSENRPFRFIFVDVRDGSTAAVEGRANLSQLPWATSTAARRSPTPARPPPQAQCGGRRRPR